MARTAFSMPRFTAMGLAPAATVFAPTRKIAWASTVAVVVPSPATSEVLEATSRTICAPMFSSPSFSSISLATVTPSLVMVGEPNFFSMTTLRPLGPSVTFTASARMLTPRRIACRDSSPCRICFAICAAPVTGSLGRSKVLLLRNRCVHDLCLHAEGVENRTKYRSVENGAKHLLLDDAEDFFLAHDQELFAVQFDFGARVFAEEDGVALLDVQREDLALVVRLALADSNEIGRA